MYYMDFQTTHSYEKNVLINKVNQMHEEFIQCIFNICIYNYRLGWGWNGSGMTLHYVWLTWSLISDVLHITRIWNTMITFFKSYLSDQSQVVHTRSKRKPSSGSVETFWTGFCSTIMLSKDHHYRNCGPSN